MKRFHWPLQRLLDVTVQREQLARMELLALSRQLAHARGQIMRVQAQLRTMLEELTARPLVERLARQELVQSCAGSMQRQIEELRASLRQLEEQRREKTQAFMRLRSSRQMLEKVRQEALRKHHREQALLEQKQLDEAASVRFARKAIVSRTSDDCPAVRDKLRL